MTDATAPTEEQVEQVAAATLSALQEQNKALREALENMLGYVNTPISRRRLGISGPHPEWLTTAIATLEANKQEGGE